MYIIFEFRLIVKEFVGMKKYNAIYLAKSRTTKRCEKTDANVSNFSCFSISLETRTGTASSSTDFFQWRAPDLSDSSQGAGINGSL